MIKTLLTAVYDDNVHAARALDALVAQGFERHDISVLMAREVLERLRAKGEDSPLHEAAAETARGAGLGALLGGTLAALVAAAVSLTGIGLVVAGPLAITFGATALGATAGGFLGSLVGMGVHDDVAKTYERDLQGGAMLVAVDTAPERAAEARQLLLAHGGRNVAEAERD